MLVGDSKCPRSEPGGGLKLGNEGENEATAGRIWTNGDGNGDGASWLPARNPAC